MGALQYVPWIALIVATGFSWSLMASVAAIAEQTLGLHAVSTLWGTLLSLVGAFFGAFGTVWIVQKGWDPRLRVLEWLFFCGVLAVRIVWGSGLSAGWSPSVSFNLIWASMPVVEGALAWIVGERITRAWVHVAGGGRASEAHTLTFRYASVLILSLCGTWAAASFIMPSGALIERPIAILGGVLCVAGALVLITALHHASVTERLVSEGVHVAPDFHPAVPSGLVGLVVAVVVLGTMLPANLSPFQLRDFNQWMVILTERFIGPLLVPSQGPARGIGEGLRGLSMQSALEGLEAGGSSNPAQDLLSLSLQIVLFVGVAYFAWRIFRSVRNAPQGTPGFGSLSWGLRWLYQEVRSWVIDYLTRIGILGGKGGSRLLRPKNVTVAETDRSKRTRPTLNSVGALYRYVLSRLADRGVARRTSETPYEYLRRCQTEAPSLDEKGLPYLTQLYVAVYYQERLSDAAGLREARGAAARALRGWTRAAIRSRLFGWMKRR